MKTRRAFKMARLLATGAIMLQAAGCDINTLNDYLQTILLGITAAGAVAILQNI